MYSDFFKLKVNPFGETPDTRFFFRSQSHVAALDLVIAAIRESKGFSLITGEVGVGKTVLSRVLLNYLQARTPTALILNPLVSQHDLFTSIREEYKLPPPTDSSIKAEYDQLSKFLLDTATAKKRSVLIIDEAQRLSFDGLEEVRLLSNLETEERKLLQIILIGQPELKTKLDSFELRQLNQRISAKTDLTPLSESDVETYIKHRIEIAGGLNFLRFETNACTLIAGLTYGVPRLINILCEHIVSIAERDKVRLVDSALIKRMFPAQFTKQPSRWLKAIHSLRSQIAKGISP